MILKTININEINVIEYFNISYPENPDGLGDSIKKQGLLSPLRLICNNSGKYRLFSGFRRLRAVKDIGIFDAPSFIYNEDELNEKAAFISFIEENRKERGFNDFEISSILDILTSRFNYSKKEIVTDFSGLLGIGRELMIHEKYRALSAVNAQLKEFIAEKKIPIKISYCLSKWDNESQKRIASAIGNIHLTHGDFSKFITLIDEIAGMEEIPHQEIITNKFIENALSDKELSAGLKMTKILNYLEKRRFPEKYALEEKIKRIEMEFSVTGNIKVKLPHLLEGDNISIEINGKNDEAFEEAKTLLESKKFQEKIRKLFNDK